MITVSEYAGQAVGVFGLGKAGEATIASLLAGGARVFAWDDSEQSVASCRLQVASKNNAYNLQLTTCNYADWPWAEIKALVLSPGVPLTHPAPHPVVAMAHQHQCPVIGDIELLYRAQPNARYVGITGTNGKSTTTTLVAHILATAGVPMQVGGNLGQAALSLDPLGANGVYVLETSSYQLDLLQTVRFNVAALLNFTPDHIDRHGSMEGYIAAKMHIFDRQQATDVAVIAVDDEYTREVASCQLPVVSKAALVKVSAYGSQNADVYVSDGIIIDPACNLQLTTYNLTTIPTLTGRHNWQNAVVAYAICKALGVAPDVIYQAMKSFSGLRHRMQNIATIHGVRFVNDSKATNADATKHALAAYDDIYWILGGKAKEGGIDTLSDYFPKIRHAFLIGAAQDMFAQTLGDHVPHTRCDTLDNATRKASELAFKEKRSGAVVLLSPACASFDQWKSFEHRGDAFCEMVESLKHAS